KLSPGADSHDGDRVASFVLLEDFVSETGERPVESLRVDDPGDDVHWTETKKPPIPVRGWRFPKSCEYICSVFLLSDLSGSGLKASNSLDYNLRRKRLICNSGSTS